MVERGSVRLRRGGETLGVFSDQGRKGGREVRRHSRRRGRPGPSDGLVRAGERFYPPDWPGCIFCGAPVLEGHLTCGGVGCDERLAREKLWGPVKSEDLG